ncbi:hypothetical protein LOTGIDRAFT_150746 [Lottia gigantea]|uniref:Protein SYS1 homolog n=1 Tax=Lottia gigantea TaxID=225164 RepID=V4A3W1_LOTGI|nr:hypothetical protein LOTGIDRAFT_150746 [Lottia gigantea]ESO87911.1 hypothetical protein LOTGIDRAFT_150746 [Lottia gigantea]
MTGQFRSNVWDPVLIISQIICVQSVFYVSLGFWMVVLDFIGAFDLSVDQMFTMSDLGLGEDSGRANVIAFGLNSLTCSVALLLIVGRTKQCLDFSSTILLFHFIFCWIFNGHIPQTFWWWITNVASLIFTTVLAEYLCMVNELKAIPVMGPKVDL